jgi:hypothetical protein
LSSFLKDSMGYPHPDCAVQRAQSLDDLRK